MTKSVAIVTIVAALGLGTSGQLAAQSGSGHSPERHAQHQQMMARMDSLNTRLDSLVRVMDSATGSQRTDAMAAILKEMVAHHRSMCAEMKHEGSGGRHGEH